jgi:hypothetical protein
MPQLFIEEGTAAHVLPQFSVLHDIDQFRCIVIWYFSLEYTFFI